MARPEISCPLDLRAEVGEGAVWDAGEQALYWVDIPRGHLYRFDPATGTNRTFEMGEPIGCLAPRERAVKLHTWMPPIPGAPDVRLDYQACAAVREAVGADIPLMLDPNHWYSRQDALWLGRQLEELDFLWMEEPMEEASLGSYQWLSAHLSLNILGPESMAGKHWTRAV